MKNDLLPLGSVVVLNDGVKKVMIVGYLPVGDDDKVFDYCGCVFPEGIMENCYCLFDEENIRKVYFEGCKNKETEIYLGKINSILNKRDTANILSNSPKIIK